MNFINIQQKLLNGFEHIANKYLLLDQDALKKLSALDGKVIHLNIIHTDIDLFILLLADRIRLASQHEGETDVVIKAQPTALLRMLTSQDTKIGNIEIIGDVLLAQSLLSMFKHIDIDWEEYLSQFVGDINAHKMGNLVRAIDQCSDSVTQTMGVNCREYLYYEKNILPNPRELEDFYRAVDELNNDVERLQQRIQRLGLNNSCD